MPVDTEHDQFSEAAPKWQRMRAVLAGEDRVKELGEIYLPKLTEQTPDEYNAYKLRAQFFNATARTRDGFSGFIFRKPPTLTTPDSLKAFIADCDLAGQSFTAYLKHVTDEVIGVGRIGTLIDWQEQENRPYLAAYTPENILNWRMERINGRSMLSLLVLKERVDADSTITGLNQSAEAVAAPSPNADHGAVTGPGPTPQEQASGKSGKESDPFAPQMISQIRVYRLIASPQTQTEKDSTGETQVVALAQVVCEIYRKQKPKDDYVLFGTLTPKRRGQPLPEIPFVFHGPRDASPEIERPPLEDIAQVNLSHYRTSADLEHGRHFTGLPTPWIAGFDPKTIAKIGSTVAWVSSEPNAKAGFLEFTGQGLDSLKVAIEQKEQQMAVLGARMLEAPKKAAETAEAMTLRASGEGAVLSNIVESLSQSLTTVLKWVIWWYGAADKKLSEIGDEASVALNKDFAALKLDGREVLALVQAWQVAAISRDSLVYILKQAELISPSRTVEEEIDLIDTEKIPPRALPPANQNQNQ